MKYVEKGNICECFLLKQAAAPSLFHHRRVLCSHWADGFLSEIVKSTTTSGQSCHALFSLQTATEPDRLDLYNKGIQNTLWRFSAKTVKQIILPSRHLGFSHSLRPPWDVSKLIWTPFTSPKRKKGFISCFESVTILKVVITIRNVCLFT